MNKQNRADHRKYHFIYKTTNLINHKYYIGMHSTNNLNDGYLGSGTRLWRSIQHYGKENFNVEIQEFLPNRESLRNREEELVNEEILKDPFCMNICKGGYGDFDNANPKYRHLRIKGAINANRSEKRTKNPIWLKKISDRSKRLHAEGKVKAPDRTGCILTEAHKMKIGSANSVHQYGSGNSQHGTIWIFSDIERISRKAKKTEILIGDWKPGRKMYKGAV